MLEEINKPWMSRRQVYYEILKYDLVKSWLDHDEENCWGVIPKIVWKLDGSAIYQTPDSTQLSRFRRDGSGPSHVEEQELWWWQAYIEEW